jgi:PKD repeat protein
MPKKRLSPILGLLAACLVALPWAFAAENISQSPNYDSWAPRVSVDSHGNFYVVWGELSGETYGDVYFAKYTKDTETWSDPRNLSQSGRALSEGHDVSGIAVDGNDNVHVVWTEGSIVRLRSLIGGEWTQAGTIGEGSSLEGARIAAVGSGNLYVAWWGRDGVVRSRARINQNWESVRNVSGSRRAKFSDIAAGHASVMIVFAMKGSEHYNAAYTVRPVSYGAGWSTPAFAWPERLDQIYPDVEFLHGTMPHIIFAYENVAGSSSRVSHIAWTGGGFSAPVKISRDESVHCPSLVTAAGGLVAVWQVGGWDNGVAVYYNYYSGGSWATPAAFPNSNGGTYGDAALDPSGTGLAVWDSGGEIMALFITGEEPEPDNVPPVAGFNMTPNSGSAPLKVDFNAGASYDSDGTITAYNWVFDDGATGSGKTVSHTFAKPGTYTIQLTVVDDDGATDSITHDLEVINKPPVAGFTINPETGIVPVKLTFDASPSHDPDGKLILYDWIFSDGVTTQGKTIERNFTLSGTYTVKLTVTDNFSSTAFKVKSFILLGIKPPLNVRWESFTDASLFMTRTVTDVNWEANPANEAIAVIVKYRVFRKPADNPGASFQLCGETDGATFMWRDTDVDEPGRYIYAVTAMDAAGHESSAPTATPAERSTMLRKDKPDSIRRSIIIRN